MDWIANNIFLIVVVIGIIFLLSLFFRIVKFVLVIGVIVLILGAFGFLGDDFDVGNYLNKGKEYTTEKIQPMVEEAIAESDIQYDQESGDYIIKTSKLTIEGTKGQNMGTVSIGDQSYEVDLSFVQQRIENEIENQEET